jgi:hypothetical protein
MIITAEEISEMKFGKLKIKVPKEVFSCSDKKTEWICDCGKEKIITIKDVVSGNTKTCGRCKEISAEKISNMKFGSLRIKTPQNITKGSNKKIEWICDCGRETNTQISLVISEKTSSCGRCKEISAEKISNMKFGSLRIKKPQNVFPSSHNKIEWICDCGREICINTHSVLFGLTIRCGRCNEISIEEISKMKFNKLRIKTPQSILSGSSKKTEWICDCGNIVLKQIVNVTNGHTTSCGDCHKIISDWYFTNKEKIRSLKYPIQPSDVPSGGIIPLEVMRQKDMRFRTLCPACQKPWTAYWNDIRRGESLTCGCCTNRVSIQQRIICEYLKQFDPDVQLEYKLTYKIGVKVKNFHYDIFVPSKKLLIEYDGMLYHSSSKIKERDLEKEKLVKNLGYNFMRILESDWIKNKENVRNNLKGLFN